MSKKVLKLAGRRPMLLALTLMTTLALGLLFSGWLTPTPGKAQPYQPNPPPNNETTNCPPVWGSWQADPQNLPTISITFSAPGDQCVQQNIQGLNGLVGLLSVSAGSPTTKDGGKFQVDTSGCNNPTNTGTLSITLGKTTWTASGCGANPTSGTGDAIFNVNAVGQCTVTFTAHGTTTDPSGTYAASAPPQTFNVYLNQSVGQAPGKNPYTVTLSAPSSKNGTYDSPTVNDTYTHYAFSGDFGPVMANVTYKLVSGQYFSDCCKAMTQRTLQLVGWDIKPELGIKLPIPGDFLDMGITVEYKGDTNPNFLVFNDMPATDHKQWSANLYLQNVAPNSTSFTGGVTATTYYYIDNPPPAIHGTWVAGDPKYTPYYNQEVDFISGGSGSYSDEYDWTTINTDCCPCQN